jgi:Holliday junction resolvase - archaeal type
MSHAKRKASRAENELATTLWSLGYAVVRGPSSGGGVRRRFQPDLVAARNGVILVFEVKTGREGEPVYVDSSQVLGVQDFARRAGGVAYIAVRLEGGEWRFHPLESLEMTRRGNFKVGDPRRGLRLRDLEEKYFPKTTRITGYLG